MLRTYRCGRFNTGKSIRGADIYTTMKWGGKRTSETGFTLTETLIVMAVTGIIFLGAVVYISGKQGAAQFTASTNSIKQQIQQIVNETGNGYYPGSGSMTCYRNSQNLVSGTTPPLPAAPHLTNAIREQGTNSGCIFLGKALQFNDNDGSYNIFPLIGNRVAANNEQAIELYGADGTIPEAAAGTTAGSGLINEGINGIDTSANLNYGLQVIKMWHDDDTAANRIGAFGMITNLGPSDSQPSSTGNLQLYYVKKSKLADDHDVAVTRMYPGGADLSVAEPFLAADSIHICFASGAVDDKWALVTIGGGGSLSVNMDIKNNSGCS